MSGAAPLVPGRIPLETGAVLVGDLHLDVSGDVSGPAGDQARRERERFTDWLAGLDAPRLVVLGDLFDAWVGPAHARLPAAREVTGALAALARRGTAVDVLHGNRDFLLGPSFERETGARVFPAGVLAEPVEAPGERWLLVHGDELCTLDVGYQRLKRVLRSGPVLWAAPRVPGPLARWIAARLRRASVRALSTKPPAEKTQQPSAVVALARAQGASVVVCGHAHRFRDERPAPGVRWLVVDAFGGPRDRLRVGAGGRLEAGAALAGA